MRNPVDIVEELVSRIDYSITPKVLATDVNGDPVYVLEEIVDGTITYYFKTCNIKYLTTESLINGVRIIEIAENGDYLVRLKESITVPININQPRYYLSTAIEVNKELMDVLSNVNRPNAFPMIYFPETRKTVNYLKLSNYEMVASCRLVFAVEFLDEWDGHKLKDNCINPMLQLLELFKNVVDNDPKILIESYSVEQFSRLGEKVEGKGVIFNAINDKMGGIVVDFTMSVAHDFECLCCCPIN